MGRRLISVFLLVLLFVLTSCDDLALKLEEQILRSQGLTEYKLTLIPGTGGSVTPEITLLKNSVIQTITATPESGSYAFASWEKISGEGSIIIADDLSATTTAKLMDGDVTLRANFALNPRNLTVNSAIGGTITSPTQSTIVVPDGDFTSIAVTPWTGYTFTGWAKTSGTGSVNFTSAGSASTNVSVTGGNATIEAGFTGNPTGSVSIQNKVYLSGTYYFSNRTVTVHYTYSNIPGSVQLKKSETTFSTGTPTGWVDATLSNTHTFSSDGVKTLYVRFRDEAGNESPLYTDTVYIDSTPPTLTKYEVDQYSPITRDNPLYVTAASASNLRLEYLANDTGSGVGKVYFSNTTSKPSTAQVTPYVFPPPTYNWSLSSTTARNYYNVYYWVEDLLGNLSNSFTKQVRFDDYYEGTSGNSDIDALSGATLAIISAGDYNDRLYTYGAGNGYAYLVDTDCYKWGFYGDGSYINSSSTFWADIEVYFNSIEDLDDTYGINFYDHNEDPITPTSFSYNISGHKLIYQVEMPYINTGGYEYYFYMEVYRKSASAPYSYRPNYDIYWNFWEDEGM
jgi:hypothetical protein